MHKKASYTVWSWALKRQMGQAQGPLSTCKSILFGAHTRIEILSYHSKPGFFFFLLNRSIPVCAQGYWLFAQQAKGCSSLLCHSADGHRLFCHLLFNSSFETANFFTGLSPPYGYWENEFHNICKHHLPMKKERRTILILHLENWGVKRTKLG